MTLIYLNYSIFFLGYLLRPGLTWAIAFLAIGLGWQLLSYSTHFNGGWEAGGNTHPFNEAFIFASIVLATLAVLVGFFARIVDMAWRNNGRSMQFRAFSYLLFAILLAGSSLVAISVIPLSFERPIDLKLCDKPGPKPDYCALVTR